MPKGRQRIISITTSLPVMHMPVHDGDHNGVARTLVGLSWELCCWRQWKRAALAGYPEKYTWTTQFACYCLSSTSSGSSVPAM